ncbi:MAG TPA: HEAT repeat domain-containing protein [Myxococcaceae bacterium]|nr:HEAT repeat domain-containing protein [Myxococcaceae bacterium]
MDASGLEEERYRRLLALDLRAEGALQRLEEALSDQSWRVRKVAADRFAQIPGGTGVTSALIRVMGQREQTGARNAAAEALVHLGGRAVEPLLAVLSGHEDPDQRKFAADVLGQIGAREAVGPLLAAASGDADVNVRAAAAEALGGIGGEDAVRGLEAAFASGKELLRACALEALIRLGAPPPLPSLVPLLDDPGLRRAAYRALGLVKQPAAFELLARGLSSRFRATREAALAALGVAWRHGRDDQRAELEKAVLVSARKVEAAPEVIASALEGDDPELKVGALVLAGALEGAQPAEAVAEAARDDRAVPAAIHALSRLGAAAGRALLPKLGTLSAPARAVACEALVGMADPSWVPPLVDLLGSGEPDLQRFAARALGRTGSEDALWPLLSALSDVSLGKTAAASLALLGAVHPERVTAELRAVVDAHPAPAAVWVLAKLGGESARAALRKALSAPDAAVRAAAAEAAGDAPAPLGLELLRQALADEAAAVRAAAARGLGSLPEGGEELIQLALKDPDAQVQLAAVESAGEARVRSVAPALGLMVGAEDGLRASRAVRALARVGGLSEEHLRVALAHRDPEVIKEALACGAALAGAAPLSAGLLGHERWDVRVAAARAIRTCGTSAELPAVRAALEAEADSMVRAALAEAAAQLASR